MLEALSLRFVNNIFLCMWALRLPEVILCTLRKLLCHGNQIHLVFCLAFCGDVLSDSCGICSKWKEEGKCETESAEMFCARTCEHCKEGNLTKWSNIYSTKSSYAWACSQRGAQRRGGGGGMGDSHIKVNGELVKGTKFLFSGTVWL